MHLGTAFQRVSRILICAVLLSPLFPGQSLAKKSAGILYGYSAPSSDSASSRFSYGLLGATDISTKISLGMSFVFSTQDLTYVNGNTSTQYKFNMTFILLDANFNADGLLKGLSLGLNLGFTKVDFGTSNSAAQGQDVNVSGLATTFGPKAAFDYEIGKGYAVGAVLNYLFVNSIAKTNDVTGAEQSIPRFKVFNMWGTFKIYF